MKIEDVMTRRVVAARADTDLSHVARLMWDNDCGCVPVVDAEDRVVGILTDRDLCMSANFSGRPLGELRAAGCMASEVVTCRASDAPGTVAKLMGTRKVRRVPVTDEGGRLIGLVSVGDLVCAAAEAVPKDKKAILAALVDALTAICARPAPKEVAPAPRAKKSAAPHAKSTRSSVRKRARV